MLVIENFKVSHTKSPHFCLGPHVTPTDLLFSNFYTNTPAFIFPGWGIGQACSEYLALLHFSQNNVALARN